VPKSLAEELSQFSHIGSTAKEWVDAVAWDERILSLV
jgi:hypothetical protein